MKRYEIIWSPDAELSYIETIEFILEVWTKREADNFEIEVEKLLEKLTTHTKLCPPATSNRKWRRCVVTPQTSLIYTVNKTDKTIELLVFVDNRSEKGSKY